MKKHQNIKGFTLVELMVTLAIMGIMAAIAMPSMGNFIAKSRISNRAEQIGNLFRYAKGEAVRMNMPVVICGDTIRSDGRPSGACNSNVFNNGHADSARSGLKAFADANQNGAYATNGNPADIDLRTIGINGDSDNKFISMELQYCGTGANPACTNAAGPMQMVFFPNGQFGTQAQANSLAGIVVGNQYARFIIKEAERIENRAFWRYVVISPSGNVSVCADKGNDNELCQS
ncbi:pilus assembly FimT family protein [Neisseriaceae bacterium B1]